MKSRHSHSIPFSVVAGLCLAALILPARAFGGIGGHSAKVEQQLGLRLSTQPTPNARVGDTFEGVVLDPAKLSAFGFQGIKRGDKVTLKITGPHDAFEVLHPSSRLSRSFTFGVQGALKLGPAAIPPASKPR